MSANNAVTVLRSPSSASGAASRFTRIAERSGSALIVDAAVATPSVVPHSPQNLKGAVFSAPHLGHLTAKGSPHSPQNFRPLGFSDPHFEQRIHAPARTKRATTCISPSVGLREGRLQYVPLPDDATKRTRGSGTRKRRGLLTDG